MKSHNLIKSLSIGIISLGLLAGIGIASSNTNIHAMTAYQILHDPYADASVEKDDEAMEAYGAKQAKEGAKTAAEQDREDTFPDDTPSQQPMPVNGNYNIKSTKHVRRHTKNIVRNHRAHRANYKYNRRNNRRVKRIKRNIKHRRIRKHSKRNKKVTNRLNKQLKKAKKLLKSRKARHNKNYRKSLYRIIKNINKRLK